MSNMAYLCCSDFVGVYPSERLKEYSPELHTIACDSNHIPLLWLALFRSNDLKRQRVSIDGETRSLTAPLAMSSVACNQLELGARQFEQLYPACGSIFEHVQLLRDAIMGVGGSHITIEWIEIDEGYPQGEAVKLMKRIINFAESPALEHKLFAAQVERQRQLNQMSLLDKIKYLRERTNGSIGEIRSVLDQFHGELRQCLDHFENRKSHVERVADEMARQLAKIDGKPTEQRTSTIVDAIGELCGIKPNARFPSRAEVNEGPELSRDEIWNYIRLLGNEYMRSVPW